MLGNPLEIHQSHYYQSIWVEDANAAPRFLWSAKMRFGKTFTTYQLAKKLQTKRVLVLTFKPAVEDAWQPIWKTMFTLTAGNTCRDLRAVIRRRLITILFS